MNVKVICHFHLLAADGLDHISDQISASELSRLALPQGRSALAHRPPHLGTSTHKLTFFIPLSRPLFGTNDNFSQMQWF